MSAPELVQGTALEPTRLGAGKAACTPVVVTCNSARWIAAIHEYYRNCGLAPLFVVDSRSDDRTVAVLSERGAHYVLVRNGECRVEGLVGLIRDHVRTDWIIRFDDDECPSAELVAWLRRRSDGGGDAAGFVRRWVRFTPSGGLEYAALRSWDWRWRHITSERGEDRQFRLWHKDRVE